MLIALSGRQLTQMGHIRGILCFSERRFFVVFPRIGFQILLRSRDCWRARMGG
jgi:hypothetical protein